jgi:hypothetical protein
MICGLFSVLHSLWGGRRLARGIDGRVPPRAIEECGCAVAPLLLFALIWLFADPGDDGTQVRLAETVRMR